MKILICILVLLAVCSACGLRKAPQEYVYSNITDACSINYYGDSEWIDCTSLRDCQNSCATKTCRMHGLEYSSDRGFMNASNKYYCECVCRKKR